MAMRQTDFPSSPSAVAAAPTREVAPPGAAPCWLLLAISFWGGIVFRFDAARLLEPETAWFAQFGLAQYF